MYNLLVALNYLKALLHHIAKIPWNIFKKLELALEEEVAPPLQVEREGATAGGGEAVR
jgi:hypothetical protein